MATDEYEDGQVYGHRRVLTVTDNFPHLHGTGRALGNIPAGVPRGSAAALLITTPPVEHTPQQRHRARLAVCDRAHSPADAALLLDALDLLP